MVIFLNGAQTVTSIHSVIPSASIAGVYSRMQTVKDDECHPAINCPNHLAPVIPIQPSEWGSIVGLQEAGWTYRRIATHVGHNVSVAYRCFQQ